MKKKRIFGIAGLAAVVLAASAGIYYTTNLLGEFINRVEARYNLQITIPL